MGCGSSKVVETGDNPVFDTVPPKKRSTQVPSTNLATTITHSSDDLPEVLAANTNFTLQEVLALKELYRSLSSALHQDGLINKDEFQLALFKDNRNSYFAERVFEIFDAKQNSVIEFGEFVSSLSAFHPKAPLQEKADFSFRVYDIGNTGSIDRSEIKQFLVALIQDNPDLALDEAAVDSIIDQTFEDVGVTNGKISPEQWQQLVKANPQMISYMTLPVLSQLTSKYPVKK